MEHYSALKAAVLSLCLGGLAACGGGGSDNNDDNTSSNSGPLVNAGANQTVGELTNVALIGSGSDRDGDPLSFAWTQTGGPSVTINDANSSTANFDSPDVLATDVSVDLTFELAVNDGTVTIRDTTIVTVEDTGIGANSPPVAAAGGDSSAAELTTVNLDGSGSSDPDGDALSYSWRQMSGPSVSITNSDMAMASFTAPDVAAGVTEQLVFELQVNDGTDADTDEVTVSVSEALSLVTVAGRLTYQRPSTNASCGGYNFNSVTLRPVRMAPVILYDAADNELGRTMTDLNGEYSFASITANTDVRVGVVAQLVQTTGDQKYELYVRDNTALQDAMGNDLDLDERPVYEIQWGLFNTGSANINDADFTAETGWTGSAYDDSLRRAAPLAILDSLLKGVSLVTAADPVVDMGRVDVFWSVNNTYSRTENWDDPDTGQIVTAYFSRNPDWQTHVPENPSLFLRGDAVGRFGTSVINTDEFDEQVILHEWGHFFEHQLSRSDSPGGYHERPGIVDARLAWGEGWGYGIGAIAANDPVGCDTTQPATGGSLLDLENYNSRAGEQGFYNEFSMATLLWDLFDTGADGTDNDSVGFAPIYNAMTRPSGGQRSTEGFVTIFSFATYLRDIAPGDIAFIDSQLQRENIDTGFLDIWASGQSTAPANWADGQAVVDLLPLYTMLTPGAPAENLCVNIRTRLQDSHSNPGIWRYLYFDANGTDDYTLTITANPAPPSDADPNTRDTSDPDVYLYRNGVEANRGEWINAGISGTDDQEVFNMGVLPQDTYALEFHDWRFLDDDSDFDPPAREPDYPDRVCFDFTLTVN